MRIVNNVGLPSFLCSHCRPVYVYGRINLARESKQYVNFNFNNNNKPISNAPDASVTGPEARRTLRNITVRVDH